MKEKNINSSFFYAAKWSTITEIVSKLITPITNMILARIISPDEFGVVATITMIMSFADMFTDAGFQKYLVQNEFKDDKEKYRSANVAFFTNLIISIILWILIIIFRNKLAYIVGNPGLGNVIAIATVQLLMTSFSSIQMALYRRDFDFKTLFSIRIISVFVPFIVTLPLALLGFSYWSILIGTITMQLINAIVLTVKSKWKPTMYFSYKLLKEMFSFSIWSLIEAITIWFTTWIDMFIIGSALNQYYLGIYKTSTTMVNSIMSLITASIVPVLFSALSRLQNNDIEFKKMYFNIQKVVAVFVLPLGVGIYLYSNFVTNILLGNGWNEASKVIAIWGLTSSIMIVFSYFSSEVYRAKGRPKLSVLSQILHLIVLVPICIYSSKFGFWTLVYARAWIRMEAVLVNLIIMKLSFKISIIRTLKNVYPIIISTIIMAIIGYLMQQISKGDLWNLISIIICIVTYLIVLYMFPNMRKEVDLLLRRLKFININNKKAIN